MPLIPDDDQEFNLSPAVILPNENFMLVLSGGEGQVNPAGAYLLSLNSARSWQTKDSFRGIVAGMLGAASLSPTAGEACGVLRNGRHETPAVPAVPLAPSAATQGIPQCL
ncbi:hypothetical protein [Enterobacter cloacae]|uniref:Tyrosine recombinase xerD n=1 Tax=Enterobacter cloacae TaxID=550 RepID=A0A157CMN1_ENTCL|nr:hypothetical protein [Enterobacter cloacae]CZV70207.1 Tyrosine recombinase xerD [Enterobacter cloacae]SAG87640.1 Tyrosine recombinase xerD [Enterobacter cloacae]